MADDSDFFADLIADENEPISEDFTALMAQVAAARAEMSARMGVVVIPVGRKPCQRCHGDGRIACYAHVADGVCFSCGGRGY